MNRRAAPLLGRARASALAIPARPWQQGDDAAHRSAAHEARRARPVQPRRPLHEGQPPLPRVRLLADRRGHPRPGDLGLRDREHPGRSRGPRGHEGVFQLADLPAAVRQGRVRGRLRHRQGAVRLGRVAEAARRRRAPREGGEGAHPDDLRQRRRRVQGRRGRRGRRGASPGDRPGLQLRPALRAPPGRRRTGDQQRRRGARRARLGGAGRRRVHRLRPEPQGRGLQESTTPTSLRA